MIQILFHMAEVIGGHLWMVSWQVAILVMLVWLISKVFSNTPTVFRYWLWMIVLVRLCIPVGFSLPAGLEQLLGEQIEATRFAAPIRQVTETVAKTDFIVNNSDIAQSEGTLSPEDRFWRMTVGEVSGLLWAAIASLLATLIFWRTVVISRRLNASPAITRPDLLACFKGLQDDLGIRHKVSLQYLDLNNSDVPAVIGIREPKVLLPRHIADEWEIEDIRPLLLHELAHVKRGDLILNWLQVVVQAVYFFHPLVWYVNRHIRQLREELSDDLAVHHLAAGKKHYLASILRVMESVVNEPVLGFAGIGFSERKHSLGWRVERMLKAGYEGYRRISARMVSIVIITMVIGLIVSLIPSAFIVMAENDAPKVLIPEELEIETAKLTSGESKTKDSYYDVFAKIEIEYLPVGIAVGKSFAPTEIAMWGFENVTKAVVKYSAVRPELSHEVNLGSTSLENYPVLMISAEGDFSLSEAEAQNLGSYLRNGGFAIIDNPGPEYPHSDSEESLRNLLRDALGENVEFHPIPDDHMLYHVFFDFDDGPPHAGAWIMGKISKSEMLGAYIEGVWFDGRLVAVYSNWGYIYQWWQNPLSVHTKFGVNLVLFGALQKGGLMHQWSQQQN